MCASSARPASSTKAIACSRETLGKVVEELFDGFAGFEIVQQRLRRNACPYELASR